MPFRIDREALPFAAVLAVVAAGAWLWLPWWTVVVPLLLLAFTLNFFRDPDRSPPGDADAVICPADGRVIRADAQRISVFMNVFNVHVCRAPVAGTVDTVRHTPGRFLAAFRDDASEHNERTEIVIERDGQPWRVVLVAGLVARRIVCRVQPGQRLAAGERIGLIRFGSRVDVDLPAGARPEARVGQRVRAGETVLARSRGLSGRAPASPDRLRRPAEGSGA